MTVFRVLVSLVLVLTTVLPVRAETLKFVTTEYPPYCFLKNSVPAGIYIDVLNEAAKRMGMEAEFSFMDWVDGDRMARAGDFHGIFPAFKTPDRVEYYSFGEMVAPEVTSFFARSDSRIKYDGDVTAVGPYRIGVVKKYSYGPTFDVLRDGGLFPSIREADTDREAMEMLLNREVDLYIVDKVRGLYLLKEIGASAMVDVLEPPVETTPAHVGFSRAAEGARLSREFNRAFRTMKKEGLVEAILAKYK